MSIRATLLHMAVVFCKTFQKLLHVIEGLKGWLASLMFSQGLLLSNPKDHYLRSLCQCYERWRWLGVVSLLITSVNLPWSFQAKAGVSFSPTVSWICGSFLCMPLLSLCLSCGYTSSWLPELVSSLLWSFAQLLSAVSPGIPWAQAPTLLLS